MKEYPLEDPFMTRFKPMLTLLMAMSLYGVAQAEIYESKDAAGNPVFSDEPPAGSADAEVVDLPETNTAEPVEVPPPGAPQPDTGTAAPVTGSAPPVATPAPAPTGTGQPPAGGNIVVIEDPREKRVEEELARNKRDKVLDAEPRHEVQNAEPRHEIPDTEARP
jgi:hypothetical protein